jgi:hypothetical protein
MSIFDRMTIHVDERLYSELANLERVQSRLSSGDHDADEMLRIAAEAIDDAVSSLKAALS